MTFRNKISKILVRSSLYHAARAAYSRGAGSRRLAAWEAAGRPAPPPHIVKQLVLRETARLLNLKTLVETGTYLGDMVNEMCPFFDHVYSIELSAELSALAKRRFSHRKNVTIFQGDSGRELLNVVKLLKEPTLFWLDGHYSFGMTAAAGKHTPIFEELDAVFSYAHPRSAIVIDDARLFGSDPEYPSINEIIDFTRSRAPEFRVYVKFDSIRIVRSDSPPPADYY